MPDLYARHDHWVTEWDEAYRAAVRHAVTLALSAHGGEEAAEVHESVEPRHGLWTIDLTPKRTGAAAVSIAHLEHADEVTLSFGRTHIPLGRRRSGSRRRDPRDLVRRPCWTLCRSWSAG